MLIVFNRKYENQGKKKTSAVADVSENLIIPGRR